MPYLKLHIKQILSMSVTTHYMMDNFQERFNNTSNCIYNHLFYRLVANEQNPEFILFIMLAAA